MRGHAEQALTDIFEQLLAHHGPQHWWPTHTGAPWEVAVGAVLTQRTSWSNVEKALGRVLGAWGPEGLSRPEIMLEAPDNELATLVRPAGFYGAKPRKLKGLARFFVEAGGIEALRGTTGAIATPELRESLLAIWGIGPETADAILLYALARPVFVADAYAARLAARWGLLRPGASYGEVQALFTRNLSHDTALFNEYHALIVQHGKRVCRPRAMCELCPLRGCPSRAADVTQ